MKRKKQTELTLAYAFLFLLWVTHLKREYDENERREKETFSAWMKKKWDTRTEKIEEDNENGG